MIICYSIIILKLDSIYLGVIKKWKEIQKTKIQF